MWEVLVRAGPKLWGGAFSFLHIVSSAGEREREKEMDALCMRYYFEVAEGGGVVSVYVGEGGRT